MFDFLEVGAQYHHKNMNVFELLMFDVNNFKDGRQMHAIGNGDLIVMANTRILTR